MAVTSIAALPFERRPVLELLHLDDETRAAPDPDYAGFGHARVAEVELVGADGARTVVTDALLIAVHSMDDAEALADDVELEFVLDAGSVSVLASAFLARWLPRLRGDERAVVLVMCNPHHATLAVTHDAPIHYAIGDVESWLVDGASLRLTAVAWRTT